jgi:predicted alpha/beta-hydrolase family hydrolase
VIDTPHGPARTHLYAPDREPRAALMLGHGAGGGFKARDLQAVTKVARGLGYLVVHVEQPYLVAGRRSAAPTHQLDAAWLAVVEHLRANELAELPLVSGGRSSGARVACRTAAAARAVAVLCLAFPVHPPGKPEKSRLDELDGVRVPVLVVQGESDPFGMPSEAPARELVVVPGAHSFNAAGLGALTEATRAWLGNTADSASESRAAQR